MLFRTKAFLVSAHEYSLIVDIEKPIIIILFLVDWRASLSIFILEHTLGAQK